MSTFFSFFFSKYIFNGAIDGKFSPDVSDNPGNPHMQRNQNKQVHIIIKRNDTEWTWVKHMMKRRCKNTWKTKKPADICLFWKQSFPLSVQFSISWFSRNWWLIKKASTRVSQKKPLMMGKSKELSQAHRNLSVAKYTAVSGCRHIS